MEYRARNLERALAYRAAYKERELQLAKSRHAANPEPRRASVKKWQQANPEKVRARNVRDYYSAPDKHRERAKAWRIANPDKVRANQAAWRSANPDKIKASNQRSYAKADKAKLRAAGKEWQNANRDKVRQSVRKWNNSNTEVRNEIHAKRRFTKFNATPAWANRFFIQEAYRLAKRREKVCGGKWHVDHIVPLQSKLVCGLHVEHNLRVIRGAENVSKSNRHWPDMPSCSALSA